MSRVSKIKIELYYSDDDNDNRELKKLYFFIKICLIACYSNNKNFKENALFLKDKYDIMLPAFGRDPIFDTLKNLSIDSKIKKFPGFTVKNDRIFLFIKKISNNNIEIIKDVLFDDNNLNLICDIINNTKTNI